MTPAYLAAAARARYPFFTPITRHVAAVAVKKSSLRRSRRAHHVTPRPAPTTASRRRRRQWRAQETDLAPPVAVKKRLVRIASWHRRPWGQSAVESRSVERLRCRQDLRAPRSFPLVSLPAHTPACRAPCAMHSRRTATLSPHAVMRHHLAIAPPALSGSSPFVRRLIAAAKPTLTAILERNPQTAPLRPVRPRPRLAQQTARQIVHSSEPRALQSSPFTPQPRTCMLHAPHQSCPCGPAVFANPQPSAILRQSDRTFDGQFMQECLAGANGVRGRATAPIDVCQSHEL